MTHNPYFDDLSEAQIQEKLNTFKQLDIESLSIAEIQEKIGELIVGHNRKLYKLNPTGLNRARINYDTEVFLNSKDIWYPDYSTIDESKWKYGRCNDKGESIFYASSETDTAICEMYPGSTTFITLIECIPKNKPLEALVHVVGVDRLTEARNDFKLIFENHYKIMKDENEQFYNKNLLIDNFINEQFTQVIPENEKWRYKISIAITKILMSTPNVVGLIYPSIAANSKGANFVFKTDFVDSKLQITKAGMYEVNGLNDLNISVRLIMSPDKLCTDGFGELTWKCPDINEASDFMIKK